MCQLRHARHRCCVACVRLVLRCTYIFCAHPPRHFFAAFPGCHRARSTPSCCVRAGARSQGWCSSDVLLYLPPPQMCTTAAFAGRRRARQARSCCVRAGARRGGGPSSDHCCWGGGRVGSGSRSAGRGSWPVHGYGGGQGRTGKTARQAFHVCSLACAWLVWPAASSV